MPWRWDPEDKTVEVVVESDFRGDLGELAAIRCVWIVDSPQNKSAIDACGLVGGDQNLCEVSRCRIVCPGDRIGELLSIMGDLDDHHAGYNLSVHGVIVDDSLRKTMFDEGFEIVGTTVDGFLAERIPGAREHLIGLDWKPGDVLG